MNTLIGLTGFAGHGKSTVAAHLQEHHGFVKMGLADEVKAMARRINPILDWGVDEPIRLTDAFDWAKGDENLVKASFPEYRRFLQHLGTDGVRKIAPDFWVLALKTRITAHQHNNEDSRIVVDDVRFPNEACLFPHRWYVNAPGNHSDAGTHESESHAGNLAETYTILNNSSLEALGEAVDLALKVEGIL